MILLSFGTPQQLQIESIGQILLLPKTAATKPQTKLRVFNKKSTEILHKPKGKFVQGKTTRLRDAPNWQEYLAYDPHTLGMSYPPPSRDTWEILPNQDHQEFMISCFFSIFNCQISKFPIHHGHFFINLRNAKGTGIFTTHFTFTLVRIKIYFRPFVLISVKSKRLSLFVR